MREIIEQLNAVVAKEFTTDLPSKVERFDKYLEKEPQFFPHASGTIPLDRWQEVEPQSLGATAVYPVKPPNVMVLGNYSATVLGMAKSAALRLGGFRVTWQGLRRLLGTADISPREVFLTNVYIGVPDLPKEGDPFPTTPEYTGRCQRFLQHEIELIKPHTIICLGAVPSEFLSGRSAELRVWRPFPSYRVLDAQRLSIIRRCHFGAHVATAVAAMHPSARPKDRSRRSFEGKTGWEAEGAMIRKAHFGV